MTVKDLGRWGSLDMILRYTKSVRFEESLRLIVLFEVLQASLVLKPISILIA
jgi:hypothetical protein